MNDNRLSIKILSFYSTPEVRKAIWVTEEEEEKSQTEQIVVFAEIPYQISLKEYEKTGLDVIFFG